MGCRCLIAKRGDVLQIRQEFIADGEVVVLDKAAVRS
jgi:hypothetical protein